MDYIREANRVLKPNGHLKIAEIVSRIRDDKKFIRMIESVSRPSMCGCCLAVACGRMCC